MIDMRVTPYNQERYTTGRKKVTLYFVGVEYWAAHKGYPPPVVLKMQDFAFPDIGESIVLDSVYAKDMVFKTRYKGKPVFVSEEEGGKRMAKLIKDAIANDQDLYSLDLDRLRIRSEANSLTDDEIMALAKARNLLPPTEFAEEVIKGEEDSTSATKTVGRPPSKKEK